ncbi:ankyrin repeat protein, putative [Bodo saltans]|uniref:Ankyrin repeat protein, putative n=1 Tax=Bodo saltans TaxID=75058 RepID=A0A0S4JNW9_BODSA|nr:ankyrin repeat protein, putative [Bodo saltans]|eukprot:CUG91976.1 ankyrin repeat protein, putative [Bodo saltans]
MSFDVSHSPQPPVSDPTSNPRTGSGGPTTRRRTKRVSSAEYSDRSSGEFSRQQQGESITTQDASGTTPDATNSPTRARRTNRLVNDSLTSPNSDLDVSRTMRPDEARAATKKLGMDDDEVLAVDTASPVSGPKSRARRGRTGGNRSPQAETTPQAEPISIISGDVEKQLVVNSIPLSTVPTTTNSNTSSSVHTGEEVLSSSIDAPVVANYSRRRRHPQQLDSGSAVATEEVTHHVTAPSGSTSGADANAEVMEYQIEDPVATRRVRRTSSNSNVARSRSGSGSSTTPQHHDASSPVPEHHTTVLVAHTPQKVATNEKEHRSGRQDLSSISTTQSTAAVPEQQSARTPTPPESNRSLDSHRTTAVGTRQQRTIGDGDSGSTTYSTIHPLAPPPQQEDDAFMQRQRSYRQSGSQNTTPTTTKAYNIQQSLATPQIQDEYSTTSTVRRILGNSPSTFEQPIQRVVQSSSSTNHQQQPQGAADGGYTTNTTTTSSTTTPDNSPRSTAKRTIISTSPQQGSSYELRQLVSSTPSHQKDSTSHSTATSHSSPEHYGTIKRTLSTSPPTGVPAPPPITIQQQQQLDAHAHGGGGSSSYATATTGQLQRRASMSPESSERTVVQRTTRTSNHSPQPAAPSATSIVTTTTTHGKSTKAGGKKKKGEEDDDDIELSSCSSSGSSDEEESVGRRQQRSGSTFGESTSSAAASPNNMTRRRSTVTQNLLAHAQGEQRKLLAIDGTEIVAPLSTNTSTSRNSVDRERIQAQVHSSASSGTGAIATYQMMMPRSLSNASNSVTSYITQPIKRQSIADIRRALSFAPSPNSNSENQQGGGRDGEGTPPQRSPSGSVSLPGGISGLGGVEEAKLGNAKVRKFVTEIRDAMVTFRKDSGIGPSDSKKSMGDASFDEIRQAREILEYTKRTATGELMVSARSGPITVESTDIKKTVIQLFDDLVKEGDRRGNMEVIRAMVTCIHSIDFASIIIVRQLHVAVCAEGFPLYLDVFLSMAKVRDALTLSQITQMLQMATGHPVYRIGLLTSLFRHVPNSPAGEKHIKDIRHLFHEAFEQAVSLSKAGLMEDRTQRTELMQEAIKLEDIVNFSTKDGGDKQTIFSRAAREGDVELVTLLLNNNLIEDVNRVQPDGTNALQQAAARGHLKVVEVLVRLSNIAPSLAYQYPGRGTALDLAMNSKNKNGLLIQMIKDRAIELRVLVISPEASPSASPTARSSSPAPMERRQSKANFARKKSIAMGAEQEEELEVINGVVDGTNVMKVLLTSLKPLYEQMQYEMSFEPQGEELRKVGLIKNDLHKAKEATTMKLSKLEPEAQIDLRKEEVRADVLDLMDKLVEETSKMAGNLSLFELLVKRLNKTFDLLVIATDHRWFLTAAANGSVEYITALMELEGAQEHNLEGFTTKEMFEAAAASTIYRIDSILHLFSFHEKLNLEYFEAILRPIWHQILEDICAVSRARPQELRSNRMQLIKYMLSHPMVAANVEKQGDDRHSIFSRACAEGDAPLVYYLLAPQGGPDGTGYVKQPNVIAADSMTPLMHAAFNGHKNVVDVFVQLASTRKEGIEMLKFKLQMQGGNAADVATRRKHKDVVDVLKKAGIAPLAQEQKA